MSGHKRRSLYGMGEHAGEDKHGSLWFLTYADLITLLLAFFVILTAASDFNPAKFEQLTQSAKQALGSSEQQQKKGVKVLSIEELIKAVKRIIHQQRLDRQVEVTATGRGVVVSGRGATFFNSGEANVRLQAMPLLRALAGPMRKVPYNIAVEGHTDNVPAGGAFASNWELSSERASGIVRFLINSGVPPRRLRAVGWADTVPKRPNTSEINRAMNRRIEIVFLTS